MKHEYTEIRHDTKRDEYRIWRKGAENPAWVGWPMNSADAARVCGIDDSDWTRFGQFLRIWRPYLKLIGVPKAGRHRADPHVVTKEHAKEAASDPRVAQAAEKLGLRLTLPPD